MMLLREFSIFCKPDLLPMEDIVVFLGFKVFNFDEFSYSRN